MKQKYFGDMAGCPSLLFKLTSGIWPWLQLFRGLGNKTRRSPSREWCTLWRAGFWSQSVIQLSETFSHPRRLPSKRRAISAKFWRSGRRSESHRNWYFLFLLTPSFRGVRICEPRNCCLLSSRYKLVREEYLISSDSDLWKSNQFFTDTLWNHWQIRKNERQRLWANRPSFWYPSDRYGAAGAKQKRPKPVSPNKRKNTMPIQLAPRRG